MEELHNKNNNVGLLIAEQTIPLAYKKFLCLFVSYFDGKLKHFSLSADGTIKLITAQKNDKKLFLIVARKYYRETSKQYPIENKKELKKILTLEFNEQQYTKYIIWGNDNGQNQVNIWEFDSVVPSARIMLPESLLLAFLISKQDLLEVEPLEQKNHSWYLSRSQNLIYSSIQSKLINSLERFSLAIGNPIRENNSFKLSTKNKPAVYALGLKKIPIQVLMNFVQAPTQQEKIAITKKIALPFIVISFLYLVFSSGYIAYQKHALVNAITQQQQNVSSVLQKQILLDENLKKYQILHKFNLEQQNTSPLWLVMDKLFSIANFSNIRLEKERYIIRGITPKATELLEMLSQNKQVIDAKFDFPTRKARNGEAFVISFKLISLKTKQDNKRNTP